MIKTTLQSFVTITCLAFLSSPAPVMAAGLPVGICINAGNHFDVGNDNDPNGKHLGADDFYRMHQVGFQTVRLTVNWSKHFMPGEDARIDPAFLRQIGVLIDAALAQKLNVLLDSHNFEMIDQQPGVAAPRLAKAWAQIAEAYRDRPASHVWFELSNEPHDAFNNANLMATLAPSLAAVRQVSPLRPVVIGGEFWSGIDSLATLDLPDDPQLYPTFHYYEPFDFTHQGANWVKPMHPLGRVYGTADDKARLEKDVAKLRAYVSRTGRTPFIGEFGAYEMIEPTQRAAYYHAVHEAFNGEGIGMCVWAYTNTFPFYDHKAGKWDPALLSAVGLKGHH